MRLPPAAGLVFLYAGHQQPLPQITWSLCSAFRYSIMRDSLFGRRSTDRGASSEQGWQSLAQVLEGLTHIHNHGIIHRDANVNDFSIGVVCRYDGKRESVPNTDGAQESKPSQQPPLVDSQHHGYVVDPDSDSESDTRYVSKTRARQPPSWRTPSITSKVTRRRTFAHLRHSANTRLPSVERQAVPS
jgi:hypothetical protein